MPCRQMGLAEGPCVFAMTTFLHDQHVSSRTRRAASPSVSESRPMMAKAVSHFNIRGEADDWAQKQTSDSADVRGRIGSRRLV